MVALKRIISNQWVFVVAVFIIWRLSILGFEFLGIRLLRFTGGFPYWDSVLVKSNLPQWLWQWANFDGTHYLTIAKIGYSGFGDQVYFPIYPFLIKYLGLIIGNYLLASLMVSNMFIILAAGLLFELTKKLFSVNTACWTIVFLFLFPTSFYFGSAYTESLFLLLALLALTRTGFLAGIFGLLAGGTRIIGVFIAPELMLFKPRNWWGLFSLGGLASYMGFLYWRFGNPLFFLSAQQAFANNRAAAISGITIPFQVIYRYLRIFLNVNPRHYDFWIAAFEFISFLFGAVVLMDLTIRYRKKMMPLLIFSWGALLLPAFSGTFSSMPRYLLEVFPIFIWLALIRNKLIKFCLVTLFIILLALLTALFTRGYWVS